MIVAQRFAITPAQINHVVKQFYALVRQDTVLAPVFAVHVVDWTTHEAKITAFWSNAILFERSYDGNPMQVHMAAGNIDATHFIRWLEVFDDVLTQLLPTDIAHAWSHLVHRIGRGLQMGLAFNAQRRTPAPYLKE